MRRGEEAPFELATPHMHGDLHTRPSFSAARAKKTNIDHSGSASNGRTMPAPWPTSARAASNRQLHRSGMDARDCSRSRTRHDHHYNQSLQRPRQHRVTYQTQATVSGTPWRRPHPLGCSLSPVEHVVDHVLTASGQLCRDASDALVDLDVVTLYVRHLT